MREIPSTWDWATRKKLLPLPFLLLLASLCEGLLKEHFADQTSDDSVNIELR